MAWSLQIDPATTQTGEQPVVRAMMFWMDSCDHCHYVIEEVLRPLQAEYGEQLEILLIELKGTGDVDWLYQVAAALGLAKEQVAVPFLIIGDQVLIGSQQIPAELPVLIEHYLAAGGLDYPDLQPLVDVLPVEVQAGDQPCVPDTPCPDEQILPKATTIPAPAGQTLSYHSTTGPAEGEPRPDGFVLALSIFVGMVAALGFTGYVFRRSPAAHPIAAGSDWRMYAIPLLTVLGLGVAGYLTNIETRAVPAFCGPVGDCNTVQSSAYARLFGFLPLGLLGFAGYLAILAVWMLNQVGKGGLARYAPRLIFGMALAGTLFSAYLTYLELFVIQAVCLWCLTSAVVITLLLLVSLPGSAWPSPLANMARPTDGLRGKR
jgi:uncharacterized membrane protein